MNTNNDEIFLKYVRGVKPIKKKYKIKKNTKLHPKNLLKKSFLINLLLKKLRRRILRDFSE